MTAIKTESLSKVYKLYDTKKDRLIEAIHPLKKKYGKDFYALKEVSFAINKGETVGIIGRNGSGKSTLLKILTSLLTPSSGSVEVNGRVSALLELGAGFNPEYTGIENIYLNGTLMGFSREEINATVDDIIKFADIGEFIYQPVKIYSSGMYVRLAFALAINVDPDILIIDEALAVGDIAFQIKCYDKFAEFKKKGKTILFVTHALDSVIKYCSRVMVLHNGVLVEEGEPAPMVDVYKKIMVNCYEDPSPAIAGPALAGADLPHHKPWKEKVEVNPNHEDYGSKKAEIIDYAVFDQAGSIKNVVSSNEEFLIKMKVLFHQDLENPIFAFTIKDLKGTEITGTNTAFENQYSGEYHTGDVAIVTFKQKLNLQQGHYRLSLGCTDYENGELVVYHRLYDICVLAIISEKFTVGCLDPQSVIEITRQASG